MEQHKSLNDKIVNIIEALGFSNTKFADTISVSRPTISHIISGRNKPSIDIVQKIIACYPELGYKWFLDEEDFDEHKLNSLKESQRKSEVGDIQTQNKTSDKAVNHKSLGQVISDNNNSSSNMRRVEKVIMFYSDGSMEVLAGSPQVL